MAHIDLICGVDEAGRGPWAGPVTAAAVILHPDRSISGLTDSKKISEKKRFSLEPEIKQKAAFWAVAHAQADEIDSLNIRQATFLAMQRAIAGLGITPVRILIDGNALPDSLPAPAEAIIKGDLKEPAISAASILAKTERARLMLAYDQTYPAYGFAGHKGYGTAAHSEALQTHGPCPVHRTSFAPVRKVMLSKTLTN
ncbi:MAG: ribonuclease HII [Henriciella sp.]|nr:ribonuclease HII [Henriciella sp.]